MFTYIRLGHLVNALSNQTHSFAVVGTFCLPDLYNIIIIAIQTAYKNLEFLLPASSNGLMRVLCLALYMLPTFAVDLAQGGCAPTV